MLWQLKNQRRGVSFALGCASVKRTTESVGCVEPGRRRLLGDTGLPDGTKVAPGGAHEVLGQTASPTHVRLLLIMTAGLCGWAGGWNAAWGTEFGARGCIWFTNVDMAGGGEHRFEVFVRGCQWLIRSVSLQDTNRVVAVGYEEQGVLFKLNYRADSKFAFGIIESNNLPTDVGGLVPILWPFFGSGCVLPGNGRGWRTPVYDGSAGIISGKAKPEYAEWKSGHPISGLPTQLVYYHNLEGQVGPPRAVFRVLRTTNVGNAVVPLQGEYYRYRLMTRDETVVAAFAQFQVDHVAPRCTLKSFRPQVPSGSRFVVADFRLFHARSTNRVLKCAMRRCVWPDLDEAIRIDAEQRQGRGRTPAKPSWTIVAVLLLMIVPPVFLALRSLTRRALPR